MEIHRLVYYCVTDVPLQKCTSECKPASCAPIRSSSIARWWTLPKVQSAEPGSVFPISLLVTHCQNHDDTLSGIAQSSEPWWCSMWDCPELWWLSLASSPDVFSSCLSFLQGGDNDSPSQGEPGMKSSNGKATRKSACVPGQLKQVSLAHFNHWAPN